MLLIRMDDLCGLHSSSTAAPCLMLQGFKHCCPTLQTAGTHPYYVRTKAVHFPASPVRLIIFVCACRRSPTATAMESSGGQALIPRSHKSFTESVTPSLMAAAAVATAVTSSIGTGSSQLLRAPLSAHLPGAGSGSRTQGSMLSTRSSTTTPGQPQTATYSPTNLTTGSRVLAQASVVVMGSKPRRSSGYSSGSFSASQLLPDLLSPTRKQPAAPA